MFRPFGTAIGIFVVGISAYWGALDFLQLSQANQELTQSALELSDRKFQYLLSREKTHRINVGFEGTWILMGIGIILLSNQNPR